MVGGGSGGHITPLLAVANRLRIIHPGCGITIISERLGLFNHLFADAGEGVIDDIYYINAGKYRRFYGQRLSDKLFDGRRIILNIRDIFKLFIGIFESILILLRAKPDVVFIKGGYVGVPVGIACRLLRIAYVTHDSDALPGLTNRLIGKKAAINTVGMSPEYYSYPREKTIYVGVPITEDFIKISEQTRAKKRKELELKSSDFMLLITGGSNGALRLDDIVHSMLKGLLEKYPGLNIVHQVGKNNEELYSDYPAHLHSRIRVAGFLKPLYEYFSAADAVVARAGATTVTEIALQKKPLIIIPNPYLADGHQSKNAKIYEEKQAALVVSEHKAIKKPDILAEAVEKILNDPDEAEKLANKLYKMTKKDSADKISELLSNIAKAKRKR